MNEIIRQLLIDKADQLLKEYPQYNNYHDRFELVMLTGKFRSKGGNSLNAGDITLGILRKPDFDLVFKSNMPLENNVTLVLIREDDCVHLGTSASDVVFLTTGH